MRCLACQYHFSGEIQSLNGYRYQVVACGSHCIPYSILVRRLLVPSLVECRVSDNMYEWCAVCDDDAPFAPRDGAGAITFDGRMWLLGGWNPAPEWAEFFPRVCNSEVWSSVDGTDWRLEVRKAPWEGRHCAGTAVHDGKMWIIGGDCNQGHYQHDVWCSPNGIDWQCVCEDPPWGAPLGGRVCAITAACGEYIYIMGGQNMPGQASKYHSHEFQLPHVPAKYHKDCWRSRDGVHWQMVGDNLPWAPRCMVGGSAVLHGKMYLMGGGTYDLPEHPHRLYFHDVWSSTDGATWECVSQACPWEARSYHEIAAYDNKLWVLEGATPKRWQVGTPTAQTTPHFVSLTSGQNGEEAAGLPSAKEITTLWGARGQGTNRNDVWWSSDGKEWHQVPDTPWAPRHAASVFVHAGSLWMVAGNNMKPDVWKLSRISAAL